MTCLALPTSGLFPARARRGRAGLSGGPDVPEGPEAGDDAGGDADGLDEAGGLGAALPGDIEGRAMRDAGADDRQAERDVDRSVETDRLERDMALIVVHRDHGVELAGHGAHEQRVGG